MKNIENKVFTMTANLVHYCLNHNILIDTIWKALRKAKFLQSDLISENYPKTKINVRNPLNLNKELHYIHEDIFKTIQINSSPVDDIIDEYKYNVTDKSLDIAADLFIYLTAPPDYYWLKSLDIYYDWLYALSPRRILGKY